MIDSRAFFRASKPLDTDPRMSGAGLNLKSLAIPVLLTKEQYSKQPKAGVYYRQPDSIQKDTISR
jgi:hypothetical protein